MPQLSPILWSLFPFVLVLFVVMVMVSLFQEDNVVGDKDVGVVVEKVVGW